ncbi:TonB family protein [Gallaecimonas sp. GXIMD4217]|uniref:TonB family protein n=1 Tax=Gallaecimonas sp. GXIMD4217 TaxID=3131927 RepID=UPI00311AC96C
MLRTLALASSLLLGAPALADFAQGMASYQDKDYQQALQEFQAIARLGHANAQFNLGAMYHNGEGVEADQVQAYAWFVAAADNGMESARGLPERLARTMTPAQLERARAVAAERLASHGSQAIKAQLLPDVSIAEEPSSQAKPIKRMEPKYPKKAAKKSQSGYVDVRFDINEAGRPENIRILGSMPPKVFDKSALKAVAKWIYEKPTDRQGNPARIPGQRVKLTYNLLGYSADTAKLAEALVPFREQAEAGYSEAQYVLYSAINWLNSTDGWRIAEARQGEKFLSAPIEPQGKHYWVRPEGLSKDSHASWRLAFTLDGHGQPRNPRFIEGEESPYKDYLLSQLAQTRFKVSEQHDPDVLYVLQASAWRGQDRLALNLAYAMDPSAIGDDNHWLNEAAKGGNLLAQYQLGTDLIYGRGCRIDRQKGILWLTLAAQQGDAQAQETLGIELIRGDRLSQDWAKARHWLELAAKADRWVAKRELARILATADGEQLRDPERAVTLAQEALDEKDDPASYAVLAEAWAARGDLKKARKYLAEAIDEGEDQGWPVGQFQRRLAELERGNI